VLNDSTFVPQAMEIVRPVAQFDVIGEAKQVYDWVQAPTTTEKLYPPTELPKTRAGYRPETSQNTIPA